MRLTIHHELTVTPPEDAGSLVLQLLLTPANHGNQRVESWRVEMPGIGHAARFADAHGNTVHLVNLRPEGRLRISASGRVVTTDTNGIVAPSETEPVPTLYLRTTALTRVPVTLYGKFRNMKHDRIALLHALMERVSETYAEPGRQQQSQDADLQSQGQSQSQSQSQTQNSEEGAEPIPAEIIAPSAEQMAHAFIGAARALDIPARYVTGYLCGIDGHEGLHAWAEAYEPTLGWIGFDPELQLCPTDRHVRLAAGLDAADVRPVRAVPVAGEPETVSVEVSIA
ncbi:transglutaminase [Devosia pacifica]|uniref:Transglutaminase n=1 Tax=Devosia pacifica TaxID=1335967 RepID=A0A918S803_9HYPH|nr:transglutaminase family protein [Devosia pacifica]GHA26367.1 transglutaminase [Devosia pacifica]